VKTRTLSLLLFCSGASALVLEVCWFRRTAQIAGATSVAMAAVLAAVIGGMAVGSLWLGRVADRSRNPLRLYGLLETGVALAALLTPTLLALSQGGFDLLQRHLGDMPLLATGTRFVLATLLLAPPAVLMGGTLPAAACAVRIARAERGRALGWLYAANTLGAVAGTLAAGFILIPALGLGWATRSAALLAGAAAAGALLARVAPTAAARPVAPGPVAPARAGKAILLYAVSGCLGLAAEVAFTRHLVLVFGSPTYAFTTMLSIFLLGIGLGGAIGTRLARQGARHLARLEVTVATTAALFSLSALVVYLLPRLYLEGYLAWGAAFREGLWLRFLLSALVLLPGALGLGIAFPLAAHVATAGTMGAGTGRLYAANTFASIVGSTCAVFWLVPALGPQHAVAAMAVATGLVVALTARRAAPLVLLLVTAVGLVPPSAVARERLLSGVYFVPGGWVREGRIDADAWRRGVDLPFHAYGRESTVCIWRWYGTDSVLIDGKAVATNQILHDIHHLSLLGHLPMAIHPDPQRVLVVGLGMGTTYRAVVQHRPATARVVELEKAVVAAAARLGVRPADLVIADARSYLRATEERFDVITSDPIHPWVRGGGDLYTREYFASCRDRLTPGGVACQWLPVYQMGVADIRDIVRTFVSVFADAAVYYGGGDLVLVGGRLPPPRTLAGEARLSLERLGAADLSVLRVAAGEKLRRAVAGGSVLTDDALRLEFSTPRYLDNHALPDCLAWLRELWGDPPAPYSALLAAREAEARDEYDRMELMMARAREEAPDHPFVRRFIGEAHLIWADHFVRHGNLEDAIFYFVRARRDLGDDPRITGLQADLRVVQGRKEEAVKLFQELLARDAQSAYLRRRIAELSGPE
jgi:spermidine synthase